MPTSSRSWSRWDNDDVDTQLRRVTARRYGRLTDRRYRLALLGTRQCPYGLVRPLIGGEIPRTFDAICVAATEGILALGD
ncbi:hypothetical protein BH23ACT6_BH23ACT6_20390 [soil metagenome]